MPPYIHRDDYDDFLKPSKRISLLSSGSGKPGYKEEYYQPHVFQQSVTLTATMWDENDSKGTLGALKFGNWGILTEYSPLFMGLICGFGIVLVVMTSVVLWRYCLVSASKKLCCRGTYGVKACQMDKSSAPVRLQKKESLNGFEHFHRYDLNPVRRCSTLHRSATVDSIPLNNTHVPCVDFKNRLNKPEEQSFHCIQNSDSYVQIPQREPLMSNDVYTSHLYLEKLNSNSDLSKNLSRSTPALEDLYAKVNFSKKRKNRMRKGDAAIIAMSKSHSGNNDDSTLDQTCTAVVVYNERTAL
ncbi:hypothetical protein RUM43_009099 [Polyplax serrata]|uniref:Uncharacterized protein n=1 Tax=Polyplax serrata TaxID=468196 RepID=A0AAN8NVF9_POLSC